MTKLKLSLLALTLSLIGGALILIAQLHDRGYLDSVTAMFEDRDPLVQTCIDKIRPTLQRRESFDYLESQRRLIDGQEFIEIAFEAKLLQGGDPLMGVMFCSFNPLGGGAYELTSASVGGDAYATVREAPAFSFDAQNAVVWILFPPALDSN